MKKGSGVGVGSRWFDVDVMLESQLEGRTGTQNLKDKEKASWARKERTASRVEGTAMFKGDLAAGKELEREQSRQAMSGRRAAGNEVEDQREPDYTAACGSQLRV